MVYQLADLYVHFKKEIEQIENGNFQSLMKVVEEWNQYLKSWDVNGSCILHSCDTSYEYKNNIVFDLSTKAEYISDIVDQIIEDKVCLNKAFVVISLLSLCFGISFIEILLRQQFFEAIIHVLDWVELPISLKLMVKVLRSFQFYLIRPIEFNDNGFFDVLEYMPQQRFQISLEVPPVSDFDNLYKKVMYELLKSEEEYKFSKSNIDDLRKQNLQFLQQIQELEGKAKLEIQSYLFTRAYKKYNNLQNLYFNEEKIMKMNEYLQINPLGPTNQIDVVKTIEDLNNRKMFMLNESIFVKEGDHVEYKHFAPPLDPKKEFIIKKVITSFLNSEGGCLYIGIKDDLTVQGFQLKENDGVQMIEFLQDIISKIHPCPEFNYYYKINLFPLYSKEGTLLENRKIIRIQVIDINPKPTVFTFQEFHTEYNFECICVFYRSLDSSKYLNQKKLKDKIIERSALNSQNNINIPRGQYHNYKYVSRKNVQEYQEYKIVQQNQEQKRQVSPLNQQNGNKILEEIKLQETPTDRGSPPQSSKDFQQIDVQVYGQNLLQNKYNDWEYYNSKTQIRRNEDQEELELHKANQIKMQIQQKAQDTIDMSMIANNLLNAQEDSSVNLSQMFEPKPEQPSKERDRALMCQKIPKEQQQLVLQALTQLCGNGKCKKFGSSCLIQFDSMKEMNQYKPQIKKILKEDIKIQFFLYGNPSDTIDIKNWKDKLTKDDIEEMQQEINDHTKLFNFTITQDGTKCILKVESMDDQIEIFKLLKSVDYRLKWKLNNREVNKICP